MTQTLSPACPKCGTPTIRKPVRRGPRAGLEMWGCSRWPDCNGAINIDPQPGTTIEEEPKVLRQTGTAGGYAQARMERERTQARLKRRAMLPFVVGIAVIAMTMVFFGLQQFGFLAASVAVTLTGLLFCFLLLRLPFEAMFWTKGVEGERKTAAFVEPLLDAGYVVLYNRMIPGMKGDIDSLVIGPTGIFPIETKNWGGKIEIKNDRLFVGEHDRSWVIGQVYREALAVQVALGEELTSHRVTVTPILCAINGVVSKAGIAGGVHVVDGKHLARLLTDRPTVFDDEAVQRIARLADQRLRLPYDWEIAAS